MLVTSLPMITEACPSISIWEVTGLRNFNWTYAILPSVYSISTLLQIYSLKIINSTKIYYTQQFTAGLSLSIQLYGTCFFFFSLFVKQCNQLVSITHLLQLTVYLHCLMSFILLYISLMSFKPSLGSVWVHSAQLMPISHPAMLSHEVHLYFSADLPLHHACHLLVRVISSSIPQSSENSCRTASLHPAHCLW